MTDFQTADFQAEHFPISYRCAGCGREAAVTRREALRHAAHKASVRQASQLVIAHVKGWNFELKRGAMCPGCLPGL